VATILVLENLPAGSLCSIDMNPYQYAKKNMELNSQRS
jgi:hypothetical protein